MSVFCSVTIKKYYSRDGFCRPGKEIMEYKYWYAVMRDNDDTDWGYGSYDLDQAKEMVKKFPEGYIAVIDEGPDPVCVEEIR